MEPVFKRTLLYVVLAGAAMICVFTHVIKWSEFSLGSATRDATMTELRDDINLAMFFDQLTAPQVRVASDTDGAAAASHMPTIYSLENVSRFPTLAVPTAQSAAHPLPEAVCKEVRRLILGMAKILMEWLQSDRAQRMSSWDARPSVAAVIRRYSTEAACRVPILWHGTRGANVTEYWQQRALLPDPGFVGVWFSTVPYLLFGPDYFGMTHLEISNDSHVSKTEAWSYRAFTVIDTAVPFTNASLYATVGATAAVVPQRLVISFAEAVIESNLVRIARSRSSGRATALALGMWNVRSQLENCSPRWCLETARDAAQLHMILSTLQRGDLLVSNQGATDEWATRDMKLYLALGGGVFRTVTGLHQQRVLTLGHDDMLPLQGWSDWSWAVSFTGPEVSSRNCAGSRRLYPPFAWTHQPDKCLATSYTELWGTFIGGDDHALETMDLYQAVSNGLFAPHGPDANQTRAVEWSRTCTGAWKFSATAATLAGTGSGCKIV